MKTIQLTSPDSKQVQVSAMGATEGARRATGVAPMAGGRDSLVCSPPDPEVPEVIGFLKFITLNWSSIFLLMDLPIVP